MIVEVQPKVRSEMLLSKRLKLAISRLGLGPQKSLSGVLDYWRDPPDANNLPVRYAHVDMARTDFLVAKIARHFSTSASIMEIGCNAGRNLAGLYRAGFKNLSAIEISEKAVSQMRRSFPELSEVTIDIAPAEEAIKRAGQFDLIFTLAVLEHIHYDSDWVMDEMALRAGHILVIEDENQISTRHFPRNYRREFEKRGFRQIEEQAAPPGLSKSFTYRLFAR